MGKPVSVDEVMDYLGVGEESRQVVQSEMDSALSYLQRAAGADFSQDPDPTVCEAVRVRVWLTYYGVRGGAQNTDYLARHLTELVKQLQYTGGTPDVP